MEPSQLLGNSLIVLGFQDFFVVEQSCAQSRTKLFTTQVQGSLFFPVLHEVFSLLGAPVTITAPVVLPSPRLQRSGHMEAHSDQQSVEYSRENYPGFQSSLSAQSSSPYKYSAWKLKLPWFPQCLSLVSSMQELHSVLPGFPLSALQLETQSQLYTELIIRLSCLFPVSEIAVSCLMASNLQRIFSYIFPHLMVVFGRRENSVLAITSQMWNSTIYKCYCF